MQYSAPYTIIKSETTVSFDTRTMDSFTCKSHSLKSVLLYTTIFTHIHTFYNPRAKNGEKLTFNILMLEQLKIQGKYLKKILHWK